MVRYSRKANSLRSSAINKKLSFEVCHYFYMLFHGWRCLTKFVHAFNSDLCWDPSQISKIKFFTKNSWQLKTVNNEAMRNNLTPINKN